MRVFYFNVVSFADRRHAILPPPWPTRESGRHCVTPARAAAKHIFTGDEMLFGFSHKIVLIVSIASRFWMIWTVHTIGAMIINNLLCRKLCAAGPISPWKGS